MYDQADPRSTLAQAAPKQASDFAAADYLKFYQMPPGDQDASAKTWYGRGQNFLIAYTQAEPGAVLARDSQPDEYAILLPDAGTEVVVEAGGQQERITGNRIVFVPPGQSRVEVLKGGQIVRLFSSRAEDIAARCVNATITCCAGRLRWRSSRRPRSTRRRPPARASTNSWTY